MSMRFRKSIKLGGGTKLNLSKSGVGVSTGVKGFRVSTNTSGRSRVTSSLPGTGLSYVNEFGSAGRSAGDKKSGSRISAPSGGASGGPKPPLFQRPGIILLCLFLLAPLGIYLMWRYMPQWKNGVKISLSILFGLIFIFALIPAGGTSDNTAQESPPQEQGQQIDTADPAQVPATPSELTPESTQVPEQGAITDTEPAQEQQEQPQAQEPTEDQPQQEQPQEPKQEQPVQQEEPKDESRTVYITPTGTKYHREHCRTISNDKTAIDINDAIARGYTACKVCGG